MEPTTQKENVWKRRLPWIAAIILGLFSILAVNKYLRIQEGEREQRRILLAAAKKNLPSGHELTREDVQIRQFPAESASEISISMPPKGSAAAEEETERKLLMLIGRRVNRAIAAGQQIFWTDLATPKKEDFQSRIPSHMRAVTIGVNVISSVNNLVRPGDRVDVLFTSGASGEESENSMLLLAAARRQLTGEEIAPEPEERPREKAAPRTVVLLSGAPVLAIGQDYELDPESRNGEGYSGVTLLVSPQDGAMLTHAQTLGQLSLMLRSVTDQSESRVAPVDAKTIDAFVRTRLKQPDKGEKKP